MGKAHGESPPVSLHYSRAPDRVRWGRLVVVLLLIDGSFLSVLLACAIVEARSNPQKLAPLLKCLIRQR